MFIINRNLLSHPKDSMPHFLNSDMSINENSSVGSIKYHINMNRSEEKPIRINNITIPHKPRERSRRLYNRRDDIYLPDIAKKPGDKRGKSMFNL